MKKTKTIERNIEINEYYCDFCNKKVGEESSNFPVPFKYLGRTCYLCDKLFCKDCGTYEKIDPQTGWTNREDYPNDICLICIKIAEKYYPQIKEIYDESGRQMGTILKKLDDECNEIPIH